MKKICVAGSLNVDLTITLPRFHQPGETIAGTSFHTFLGGKGGNQAVALGRLGANPLMAGRVGDDANGRMYLDSLRKEGVDGSLVSVAPGATGVAVIEVDEGRGDNRIAIFGGANMQADKSYFEGLLPRMLDSDLLLMQLEIPLEAVFFLARAFHQAGKTVILDPAPAQVLPRELLGCTDYVTPNETELSILTGLPAGTVDEIEKAAAALLSMGAKNVIAKMGARGAMLVQAAKSEIIPGFQVKAVDTTAAGDSFNAGFAFGLAGGMEPGEAVRFANGVGALSATAMGAQGAMPTLKQVTAFLQAAR